MMKVALVFAMMISVSMAYLLFMEGGDMSLYIGNATNLRRSLSGKPVQVFRVCNGKNSKTCGYWENTKTKKKVANAPKTAKKDKVYLVLKNITAADSGDYFNKQTGYDQSITGGDNAKIYIGNSTNLKRSVGTDKPLQVYRVCNGTNKKTCGYWENTKSKKKVAKAPVTVKKDKTYLVLRNITEGDSGNYFNDKFYYSVYVYGKISHFKK
ncbi:unnamed protein product [Caenorhabditis angaria]|uniref:Uncharacterized protein n=1 Tax=Caenorhabditis angaria TaxID=860376 RepID=A0A9P1IVN3_9PELO|nr:unnamed protein product [Caenorhabditis angaria]